MMASHEKEGTSIDHVRPFLWIDIVQNITIPHSNRLLPEI